MIIVNSLKILTYIVKEIFSLTESINQLLRQFH